MPSDNPESGRSKLGIPEGFWEDQNILTFLGGCLEAHITVASNEKYKGRIVGDISSDVFELLVGKGRGSQIHRKMRLMLQQPESQEHYKAGVLTVLIARYGHKTIHGQPIVDQAVATIGKFTDAVGASRGVTMTISGAIEQRYLYDSVIRLHDLAGT